MISIDAAMFGIKFDVGGKELRDHCEARAKYHGERKDFYTTEAKRFKEEVDELTKASQNLYSNTTTQSNKERMESSKIHHQDRQRFFKFAASHLKDLNYKLTREELVSFEMIAR